MEPPKLQSSLHGIVERPLELQVTLVRERSLLPRFFFGRELGHKTIRKKNAGIRSTYVLIVAFTILFKY